MTKITVNEITERNICILKANGELTLEDRDEFSFNGEILLSSDQEKLALDLTGVNQLFSLYVGSIVDLAKRAKESGKSFTVVAKGKVLLILQQANLSELANLIDAGAR
jgi:anti-anti-sigma regulatory factor